MTSAECKTYTLPDLATICKWKATFNPHHDEVAAASTQWVLAFGIFEGKKLDFYREGGGETLCSYAWPYADAEKLRTACDFVNLLFTIDETTDEQSADDARKTGDVVLNALKYEAFDDGSPLCRMTKE